MRYMNRYDAMGFREVSVGVETSAQKGYVLELLLKDNSSFID